MLRMLKLDWSATKCYHIKLRLLLFIAALLLVGWFSTIWLVPLGVFLAFCFSVNPFLVEETGNLNRFYLTLPINRNRIVAGRYLLSLLLFLASITLALALMPLVNLFSFSRWYPDFKWTLTLFSFGFLLYALMSFSYPVLFKLGYQKGWFWGFYLPLILTGSVYAAIMEYDLLKGGTFLFDLLVYASEHILAVCFGLLGAGAALLAGSWFFSVKIYSRRDF